MTTKRFRDRLKGFAYFESFDDVALWEPSHVDRLQQSNYPLLTRSSTTSPKQPLSNVMLIHDYAGGYKDYEACQGATVSERMYSSEYLQYVETFVYFTHKLVSIPPPTWTNSCHRNGVQVLGTFLVEPGSRDIESILQVANGSFWLAHKLAEMAKCYGFEGWLINIETHFPLLSWDCDRLVSFLQQLRAELGAGGKVVWYDGLTVFNIVWYQNALTSMNLRLAQAAGSILTNYAWTPQLAASSKKTAELNGLRPQDIYIGIDVWAQNDQQGRNKRVTWPRKGGGGTGTGTGMAELTSLGLGTGIFAPAWTYEHFPGHGAVVEHATWEGSKLPDDVRCDCQSLTAHTRVHYEENPITRYANRRATGSKNFFHTSYRRAFEVDSSGKVQSYVSQMSPLPQEKSAKFCESRRGALELVLPDCSLTLLLQDTPSRCSFSVKRPDPSECAMTELETTRSEIAARIVLHELNVVGQHLELAARYRKVATEDAEINLFVECKSQSSSISLPSEAKEQGSIRMPFTLPDDPGHVLLGVTFKCPGSVIKLESQVTSLLDLFSVSVRRIQDPSIDEPCVTDLHAWVDREGEGDERHHRLRWAEVGERNRKRYSGLPCGRFTGISSHFVISNEEGILGMASANEFVLDGYLEDEGRGIDQLGTLAIFGYGFDDVMLTRCRLDLSQAVTEVPRCRPHTVEGDWILVDSVDEVA